MRTLSSAARKLLYWHQLSRYQYLSRDTLKAKQEEKLKAIVLYAYKNIPFYIETASRYKIDIDNLRFPQDINKLPFIERSQIQTNTDKMIAPHFNTEKLIRNRTSGSTGTPMLIYMDQKALDYNHGLLLYCFWELGFRPWHKCANIVGVESKRLTWWKAILSIMREELYTSHDPRINTAKLVNMKPKFVYSFPSYLELLAINLLNQGKKLEDSSVVCHGETLYDWQRKTINKAFKKGVFNTYGCTEVYLISFECEAHRGMHLITDSVYLEILDTNGMPAEPGQEGEIVITILNNYAMPLIRYRIGDTALKSEDETCPCGRNWPIIIKEIGGRIDDYFLDRQGNRISPKSMDHDVFYSPKIRQFQVIQQEINQVDLLIVKGENFDNQTEEALESAKKHIKETLKNEELNVKIHYVEEIPQEKSGKFKTFVSRVTPPGIDTFR